MPRRTKDPLEAAYTQLTTALGDWWKDERSRHCAYCGIPMKKRCAKDKPTPPNKATRDHVIPKKHNGRGLTIPACLSCNQAKDSASLQEFLLSDDYTKQKKHKPHWQAKDLWIALSLAALQQARGD